MTKTEFVAKVAEKTGTTKVAAEKAVNAVLETLTETIKAGDKVTFVGFGTFSQSTRAARTGRNPRDGKEIQIPASKSGKFTPGSGLKGL